MFAHEAINWVAILQIIWIDILLSGDNAVVIAMACRGLPENRRKLGVMLGASVAVALRVVFTLVVTTLLTLPYLRLVGGIVLLWVAVQLLLDDHDAADVPESRSIWSAVRTVAIADAVMSLDNVLAIAAAAKGSFELVIFGLVVSIPLVILGSRLILWLIDRAGWLVWAGAALLGWIAGELIAADPHILVRLPSPRAHYWLAAGCALLVVAIGWALTFRRQKPEDAERRAQV